MSDAMRFDDAISLRARLSAYEDAMEELAAEVARLTAERDALRAALQELVDRFDTFGGEPFVNPPDNVWARARAALSRKEPSDG